MSFLGTVVIPLNTDISCSALGPGRVDIFDWVANPSIWRYYLPDPGMKRMSFVYMQNISFGTCVSGLF